ncbi:hypothetical protein, partial [Streptomyces hydrogenans]|uniref:hypothetical protein n=1 Tax=Streptomyces hydrogenans TaxID=1873719 RepID=UPI004062A9DC
PSSAHSPGVTTRYTPSARSSGTLVAADRTAERDSGGRGDFAQSTALALALPTQHVTQQATEQNHRWLPPRTA